MFAVEAGIAGSVLYSTTQPSRGVPLPDSGGKMIDTHGRMSTNGLNDASQKARLGE